MEKSLQGAGKKWSWLSVPWFTTISFLLHAALITYLVIESPRLGHQENLQQVQVEIVDLKKYMIIPKGPSSEDLYKQASAKRQIPPIKEEDLVVSDEKKETSSSVDSLDSENLQQQAARDSMESSYQQRLQNLIEQKKYYPLMSHEMKESGQVTILLSLKTDGSIDKIFVDQPSKYERLNRAALKAVQQAAPFGAPPEWRKNFVVTLHFVLEG